MERFRPYRTDQQTRERYAEVQLHKNDFIYPLFVVEGNEIKREIPNLKDVYQLSIDVLLKEIKECIQLGLSKFLFFGVPDNSLKSENAEEAVKADNLVARAVKSVKKKFPAVTVITDICLCSYTSHGHCGIIENSEVDNDRTLPLLAKMALTHAASGADFVAPSAMMDGQVDAIRKLLDKNGCKTTKILSYSAKYASNFYGPFRDAANSSPSFGDRKTYQMDYRVSSQAIKEIEADIREEADWIMIKPAHTYMDIISQAKKAFPGKKLVAYHVSGEYMMIKLMAREGLLNEKDAFYEVLHSVKRAGADYIISYWARDAARLLNGNDKL